MDWLQSFDEDSCDTFDRVHFILKQIENLLFSIFKILEKLMTYLNPQKKVNISEKSNQKSDAIEETVQQPTVNGLLEIAGLQNLKKVLHTLIVLPRQQPQLFHNRKVTNSILLFGPPGTGKTRLVHGLAAESSAKLYSISVSDILSSYVGQTEKNIRELFDHLRNTDDFSILFIDELDGLCRKRNSSENEFSRRVKTELMCQMTKIENCKNMVIISATNCPWDLDSAILRRFQRRLYVPLPNNEDRLELFKLFTQNIHIEHTEEDLRKLIQICDGFSGSDIAGLVQEALDVPIIELQDNIIWKRSPDGFFEPIQNIPEPNEQQNMCVSELNDLPSNSVKARDVTILDFLEAAEHVQLTVTKEDLNRYEQFTGKQCIKM